MLHVGICPHAERWGDVLANLTHVVIDEAHVYRGVFGSHVANVIRRLRRVCAAVGSSPQFLLASATVANPAEAMTEPVGDLWRSSRRRRGPRPSGRSRCGTRRCSTRRPASARRPWPRLGDDRRARRARPAGDLLRPLAAHGRGGAPGRARDDRRPRAAPARRDRPVPGGLHGRAAPRARAPAVGGRAARRGGDQRARARHRHRAAGLRDLDRLPRHRRQPAPAVGSRRSLGCRPGGAGRLGRRARPVLHPASRDADRPARRGGDPRPREPRDPPAAPGLRRLRGADHRGRRRHPRHRRATPRRCGWRSRATSASPRPA